MPSEYADEPVGAPLPTAESCGDCHEEADMHPTHVPVVIATVPDDFPLEDGLITCSTCHAEPACNGNRSRGAPWRRGGPYPHAMSFCWRCHPAEEYGRNDPHHPAERRADDDPTCAYCHTTLPESGAPIAEARLRTDSVKVCDTCHLGDVHYGTATHAGVAIEEADRASLDPKIELDEGSVVRCWSCHEVHGDGERPRPAATDDDRPSTTALLPGPDALWVDEAPPARIRPTDPAHPSLLVLPADDGQLCRACHGVGP